MDLAHRLWRDPSVFRERAERDAAAYAAIVRTLARRRPLAGADDAFLALDRWLEGQDASLRLRLRRDPYHRFWVRLGFALLRCVLRAEPLPELARAYAEELGSEDAAALLADHLEQFQRLALGAALAEGARLDLPRPFEAALPLAIPCAAAAIEGEGTVAIAGAADGRLLGKDGAPLRVRACPAAKFDGLELPHQPYAYAIPGLGWMPPAGRTDLDTQAGWVGLTERVLAAVARHQPDVFAQMRRELRWIAVNPLEASTVTNYVSYSELPGAFAYRVVPNPQVAAESFVHEFHHSRLFALEERAQILAGAAGGAADDAVYYSPWREELRPLRGILHAVYVTLAETRYWRDVARAPDVDRAMRDCADARVLFGSLRIELGIAQLERFAAFTPEGERVFAELRREHSDLAAECRAQGLRDAVLVRVDADGSLRPARHPRSGGACRVREAIAYHVETYDVRRQVPAAWLAALTA